MVNECTHNLLLLVNIISGTNANAIPNDKTTWLMTRAYVGFTPKAIITNGGIIVINRRKYNGICMRMKPCIIISPDIVPTEELDSPADKSPIPNNAADTGPTKLVN